MSSPPPCPLLTGLERTHNNDATVNVLVCTFVNYLGENPMKNLVAAVFSVALMLSLPNLAVAQCGCAGGASSGGSWGATSGACCQSANCCQPQASCCEDNCCGQRRGLLKRRSRCGTSCCQQSCCQQSCCQPTCCPQPQPCCPPQPCCAAPEPCCPQPVVANNCSPQTACCDPCAQPRRMRLFSGRRMRTSWR